MTKMKMFKPLYGTPFTKEVVNNVSHYIIKNIWTLS